MNLLLKKEYKKNNWAHSSNSPTCGPIPREKREEE
jgi:hypothetical protein